MRSDVLVGRLHEGARPREQLLAAPLGDDAAEVDDHEPVGEELDLVQEVRGEQHRPAAVGEVAQQLAHPADPGRVEAVRRLVEDEDLGVAQQRVRDPQPLAHAERVLANALARCGAVEADEVEQAVDTARVDAHQLGGDRERLAPTTTAVLSGGVEQDPDAAAGVGEVSQAAAEHERLAGVRLGEPREHPERRRLAGAVGAEEPGHGSGLDAEGDVLDDSLPAEPLGEIL